MTGAEQRKPSIKAIGAITRRAISLSQENLVRTCYFDPERPFPLVVEPAVDGVDLINWITCNREVIESLLLQRGAILFRNFGVRSPAEFEQCMVAMSGKLMEYTYGSTPRTHVGGNVYTSTEYPADQTIPLHNEMSYTTRWPMKIWFFCVQPAERGGETPIADGRTVLRRINEDVGERFIRGGVMYVRNFGYGLDVPWRTVFQTEDRAQVEQYCRSAGIEIKWIGDDRLRTSQVCQAAITHPKTGEATWFNQAHLFHVSSLESKVRDLLLEEFEETDLPRNAFYGDGSVIGTFALNHVRHAYEHEAVSFPWEHGDILLLDNVLTAHGRNPFSGPRKILVGMAEPFDSRDTGLGQAT